MNTITVQDPWTGQLVELSVSHLALHLGNFLQLIDEDVIDEVNARVAADDNEEAWVVAYANHVGPKQAGVTFCIPERRDGRAA